MTSGSGGGATAATTSNSSTMAEADEEKCLLTPVEQNNFAFVKESESVTSLASDTPATPIPPFYGNCPLIYSEPALSFVSPSEDERTTAQARLTGMSLPQLQLYRSGLGADSGVSSMKDRSDEDASRRASSNTGRSATSIFVGSEQSCLASATNVRHASHKASFSTREIREQHAFVQDKYRKTFERRRHFTDPVDFEGILNIIGGCSWWQIWVYFFISLQQIPHAMFNLNVVYMMYQPDHWCTVPGFNMTTLNGTNETLWNLEESLDTGVVFPRVGNRQRSRDDFHDQCHYYDRGIDRYSELRQMPLDEAMETVKRWKATEGTPPIVKCTNWQYKNDVMRETIVNEWDLVCDDNFKRAHAHLFYSFGFLVGCQLGGLASDS